MKTWIGSDHHWGHQKIMSFCPVTRARFNNDLTKMNEGMVQEWNAKVEPEDLVYLLGDVAFLPAQKAAEYMNRCNGRKILVQGNHDRKTLNDPTFNRCFEEVHYYLSTNHGGHQIVMSHFPFLEWDQMHRGSLHFFGHLHGGVTGMEKYRCMDVGMDSTGEILISLDQAIHRIKDNEIKRHHV